MGVSIAEEQSWDFIRQSHTGILTTLRADGSPMALPVWFVALDRAVFVATSASTTKLRRIERDPREAFLVETGEHWSELRAVHMNGRVDVVTAADEITRATTGLDAKYANFRTANADMPGAARRHYAQRVLLRFRPDRPIISWDNRLLHADPR